MNQDKMVDIVRLGYERGDYESFYRANRVLNYMESCFFNDLISAVSSTAIVLDLGSGTGIPYDAHLISKGCHVDGIDVTPKHIEMAKKNVPQANYVLGNFIDHEFKLNYYDAVISLYSIFHVPRQTHFALLSKIFNILKRNGVLLITLGVDDVPYKEKNGFCNSKMAWSYFDIDMNLKLLSGAGFKVIKSCNENEYGSNESHVWVLATKK